MELYVDIQPGEGGDDAKLLVMEQAKLYLRYAERHPIRAGIVSAPSSTVG